MTTEELEIWKALNELKCVKKVKGHLDLGDNCLSRDSRGCRIGQYVAAPNQVYDDLWIPPLYDPIRPDRSLWKIAANIRWDWSETTKLQFMITDRPDLALSKAILEQKEKG